MHGASCVYRPFRCSKWQWGISFSTIPTSNERNLLLGCGLHWRFEQQSFFYTVWCPNANFGSLPGRLSTPIPAAIATPLGRFLTTQPNRSVANGDWDRCVCVQIPRQLCDTVYPNHSSTVIGSAQEADALTIQRDGSGEC